MLPSAVSCSATSSKPTSRKASSSHRAALAHSSGGNCRASATDRIATSSASSVRARGISSAMRSFSSTVCSLLDDVVGLQVVDEGLHVRELVGAVDLQHEELAGQRL